MWLELLDAKFSHPSRPVGRLEYDQLFSHCHALTDMPCNMFAAALIYAYSDAKDMLVRLPFQACYCPFRVLTDGWFAPSLVLLARLNCGWVGSLERLIRGSMRSWFHALSKREFKANARRVYEGYYGGVMSAVVVVSLGGEAAVVGSMSWEVDGAGSMRL
jgi:Sulfotransferase domain